MTNICYVCLMTSLITLISFENAGGIIDNVAIAAREVDNLVNRTNQSDISAYKSTPSVEPENSTTEPEAENETNGNNTDSEPDTEDETEPEDEKPEGETEPEGEEETPEPEAEDSFAEPGPEWDEAKEEWQWAWEFHVYFFGICFTILGIFCVASIIRLWKMDHLLSKNYFLSLNLLNVAVCVLRATYLFIDAYNSHGIFPVILDYFLYSTVFPCLTALFSVLFYALLLATRFRIMSKKVQKFRVLLGIIGVHFILSFVTDIVVGLSSNAYVLMFICQLFYVIWGLIMFIGYVLIFKRMYHRVINRKSKVLDRSLSMKYKDSQSSRLSKTQKSTLGTAIQITLASAFFGVVCVGFQLFGMFGVFGVIGSYSTPEPWSWWVYHTGQRLLEFVMCLSMALVSSQPLKVKHRDQICQSILCLMPCCLLCTEHNELVKHEDSESKHSISHDTSVTVNKPRMENFTITQAPS